MKTTGIVIISILCNLCTGNQHNPDEITKDHTLYVGSTPADPLIKKIFHIPLPDSVDFIRWHLEISEKDQNFHLKIHYGIGQPNTNGFMQGGFKKTFNGQYEKTTKLFWKFNSSGFGQPIQMYQPGENVLHLVDESLKMLIGNGGWSYTLNNKNAEKTAITSLPATFKDTVIKDVYVGRTPCSEIARIAAMDITDPCIKLKWLLTLYRDPSTKQPTIYELNRTQHRQALIRGTWKEQKGVAGNPNITIYQLEPTGVQQTIYFLKASKEVLFFLDKDFHLLTGNEDFSYTLNAKANVEM